MANKRQVMSTEAYFAERAQRGSRKKALAVLKKAGVGKKPVKGDEMPKR